MKNYTSEEFRRTIQDKPVVILPLGSFEQHGPAGDLKTDSLVPDYMAEHIADELDIIVLPTLSYGFSKIHDNFSGTITIDEDLYYMLIKCIIGKLKKHGVKGVVLFNGHGGNLIPIRRLLSEEDGYVKFIEWFKLTENIFFEDDHKSHAGSEELSVLAAINPAAIREQLIQDMLPSDLEGDEKMKWTDFRYMTKNGVHLNANQYSIEKGKAVISYAIKKSVNEIAQFIESVC